MVDCTYVHCKTGVQKEINTFAEGGYEKAAVCKLPPYDKFKLQVFYRHPYFAESVSLKWYSLMVSYLIIGVYLKRQSGNIGGINLSFSKLYPL